MSSLQKLATSKKLAVIITYISLIVHTLSNLVLTPLYLNYLGLDRYGLYQMIYTVASYILILDFGIKTAMVRYISKYHATNDYESEKNFSAHCLITVVTIIVLMTTAGLIMNVFLLDIYPTITAEEADVAHQLMLIMLLVISGTVLERFVSGCLGAYEHFTVNRIVSVAKLILKILLTICLLYIGMGVIAVALVDAIIIFATIIFLSIYAIKQLHFKIKLSKFDFALIIDLVLFMFPVFLQAIIGYINSYVDKTVLGIMTSKSDVAIYSIATTFVTLFNSLPSAISGVFLPKATKMIFGGSYNSDDLTNFVIRPGRYQFMLCGGFICGFALFGREFISLWAGPNTVQAWTVAMIIIIPNMIPLIQNTVLSILDALKKRLFRSVTLLVISVIHTIISVFLVSKYGMMGAPIGSAFAFIVGYGVIMNVYYQKEIKIQVGRLFKTVFSRTWICLIPAVVAGIISNNLLPDYSWPALIAKALVFIVIYGIMLLFYGFNTQEKQDFAIIIKRFRL
ncbi:oligosaccharide flippase family protein [bacterium]|nr:oligosaccharide flippase family protein [bacterium]MBP5435179.1 oligosaccharide flippase family protein [bacterium]